MPANHTALGQKHCHAVVMSTFRTTTAKDLIPDGIESKGSTVSTKHGGILAYCP